MEKINIHEVILYCRCPLAYYFKYQANLPLTYLTSSEHYDEVVQKVIFNFYSLLQNQEEPRLNSLKRAWGAWWIQKKKAEDILFVTPYSWREGYERFRKLGIQGIISFWDTFNEKAGFPLAINQPYQVKINKQLVLTGTWNLIREVKIEQESRLQILYFKVGQKKISNFLLQHDLELTAASFAFYHHFQKQEDDLLIYLFDKGQFQRTQRNIQEYNRLKEIVTMVHQGIKQSIFFPSPNEKCEHCSFKKMCKEWLECERGV